jgi:signal transduction histidine kinase
MDSIILSSALITAGIGIGYTLSIFFPLKNPKKTDFFSEELGKQVVMLEDIESISSKIKNIISKHFKTGPITIIIYNDSEEKYCIMNEKKEINLSSYIPFFFHLEIIDKVITTTELKKIKMDAKVKSAFDNYLKEFDVELLIPLIFERRLIGIINLGKRKQLYSPLEIEMIARSRREITVAYTNSLLFSKMTRLFEEAEEQNEKLKSLDKAKSSFLANVSHELRTPLISIKGYLELMTKKKLGEITEKQEKAISVAIRNIKRLERLISSLLMYAQIEADKTHLHLEESDLKTTILECIEEERVLIEKKELKLESNLEEGIILSYDKDKIKQVIINLISNAVKFTEKGVIEITLKKENNSAIVKVKDTGTGIPKDKLKDIFERFKQVDDSIERRYGGTGLGLAIVKSIIEMHKGEIIINSEIGKGTEIGFSLKLSF